MDDKEFADRVVAGGWLEKPTEPPAREIAPPAYQFYQPHWFEEQALTFRFGDARRPETAREWIRCAWNADIFYGPFPFLKILALLSLLVAAVAR